MGIVRRFRVYKVLLQCLLVVNVFLIATGGVALFHYVQTQKVEALDIVIVGLLTLAFGVVVPLVLIRRLSTTLQEMKKQTEESVARWVAGWLETYHRHDEDPVRDPYFWLNIALMSVEVFGENAKNPVMRLAADFAPLMKKELQKPAKKSKSKKVTA